MKRLSIAVLLVIIVSGISILSLGCTPGQDSTPTLENEVVTVQRGDLTIDITAVGNLALANTEDLTFDLFYPKGTVEEILVEEGDTVEEGQVLARLNTSEWEEELETLEDLVTTVEHNLTTKERALTTAELQLPTKKIALSQAEVNLDLAKYNLNEIAEVKEVQDKIDDAEADLNVALMMQEKAQVVESSSIQAYWSKEVFSISERLILLQQELSEILSDKDLTITRTVALEVAQKQVLVEQAQGSVYSAQKAVEDAEVAIEDAQIAVDDAREDVQDAQKELNEALEVGPEIIALFSGFISKINIEGGDEVLKGTVALELADPTRFEADLMVNETGIYQVRLGGEATVQVDALQMVTLPAQVTRISPSATIQSGVVNYRVKVEIQSLEAIIQERQETMQERMPDISSEEIPPRLQQAINEGRVTKEQAEELVERMRSGDFPQPGSGGQMPFVGEGNQGQGSRLAENRPSPAMIPESFQLREGLTVTVSIIVDKRTDVLLVPNGAIVSQGNQTYTRVISADGTIEERSVKTGISDWQYTEVIEGLNEDEQVVINGNVPETSTSTTQQQGGMRMPFIPGGGRAR
ncbi:efflux RND transporter periplasmic adaptor subunit [Chloroflexota bacterium]